MKKRNVSPRRDPKRGSKAAAMPWRFLLLTFICASVVAAGFFFAARQHFTSIDFGIKNSKLRKQLEDLESERRRLVLAREVSLSPSQVQRTARNLGFGDHQPVSQVPTNVPAQIETEQEPKTTIASVREEEPKPVSAQPKKPETRSETKKDVKLVAQQRPAAEPEAQFERPRRVQETDKRVVQVATTFSNF